MNEYRCTRPTVYAPGCPGHLDVTARQGYYIRAKGEIEAWDEMQKRFPRDRWFQIQLWKENVT